MKKQMKAIIIFVSVIISFFIVCWVGIVIAWNIPIHKEIKNISTSVSPNGKYEAILQQVGDPVWPFGSTSLKVVIKNIETNKNIDVIESSVSDDGSNLFDKNWEVVWYDTDVDIILKGSEQQDAIHTVQLN